MPMMLRALGCFLTICAALGCTDFDSSSCTIRAANKNFCTSQWAKEKCCTTCRNTAPDTAGTTDQAACTVPRQKCVRWEGCSAVTQQVGTTCQVVARQTSRCKRCSLVDSDSCAPFARTSRTCLADGSWSGLEPSCRSFCDKEYVAPEETILTVDQADIESAEQEASNAQPIALLNISAPPFGSYLHHKKIDRYMSHRLDVFGQWLVMFTPKCEKKWGHTPPIHVANQYAQWLDSRGTGAPNNPAVWAALRKYNATMVMFETADSRSMDKFFDKYPYDEVLDKSPFHPHDVECDETPHQVCYLPNTVCALPFVVCAHTSSLLTFILHISSQDPDDMSSYDNAYCEVSQQMFNMGYRAVYPDVFMDKKGSQVARTMDKLIGDCGHAYDHTFKYPHCTGKFHYSDRTCDYSCLVSEYEWWSLTTILGGQDGTSGTVAPGDGAGPRCKYIKDEWESCSADQLKKNDPGIYAIMTDPKYILPIKLPGGVYKPNATNGY